MSSNWRNDGHQVGPSGQMILPDNTAEDFVEGPFAPSVLRPTSSLTTPVNDQIVVGACRSVADGRTATTPGVLNIDTKQKLFTAPETVALWATPVVTGESRLLTLWVNSAATTLNLNDFYGYEFLQAADLSLYPDWKRTVGSVSKLYFPLGWITVKRVSVKDRSTDPASTKLVYRVIRIKWPCENWLLQGGGGGVTPGLLIKSKVDYRTYGVDVYGNGFYKTDGTDNTPTATTAGSPPSILCKFIQLPAGVVIPNGTKIMGAVWKNGRYEVDCSRWI